MVELIDKKHGLFNDISKGGLDLHTNHITWFERPFKVNYKPIIIQNVEDLWSL